MSDEDKQAVKSAMDDFEKDDFISAKEKIQKLVKGKKEAFLKDKLGLENDLTPAPEEDASDADKDEGDKEGDK